MPSGRILQYLRAKFAPKLILSQHEGYLGIGRLRGVSILVYPLMHVQPQLVTPERQKQIHLRPGMRQ